MAGKFTQMADEVLGGIGLIREGAPEAMKAFAGLSVCRWNSAAHALWSLISPTQLIAPRLGTTDRLTASITDHFRPHALTDAANAIGVPSATRWRRNRQAGPGLALQRFVL